MAPGNYLIAIKYGGPQHIVGSPFKAKVTGPRLSGGHSLHETSTVLVETVTKSSSSRGSSYSSIPKFSSDASKVVTRGPGLSQAFVGQKNSFTVDCSKAGTNMMMVGVHSPKTPCEEVYVKQIGNRVYNVTYTVKEKGDYILIVNCKEEFPSPVGPQGRLSSLPPFGPLCLLSPEPSPAPYPGSPHSQA
ncbi:filamin-B-like [Macaca nemestrina]|uniref:filamin-B-like n=1 Tax=Macaca nemestrina TaxID=9545 RepID=UPI0039B910F8